MSPSSRISVPEYPPAMILIVNDSGQTTLFSSDYNEIESLRTHLTNLHGPPDWDTSDPAEREQMLDAVRGMAVARVLAQNRRFANPPSKGKRMGLADGKD